MEQYKFFIVIFLILGWNLMYSQSQLPLYKMVMNSDAILIAQTTEFSYSNNQQNEFYVENNIKFGNKFTVLKNRYNQDFKKLKVKIETNNNDFYENINGEECSGISNIIEKDKKYYNIFFIKRKGKKYFIIAHLWNNILVEDLPFFENNVNKINLISREKNLTNKYKKIKEWFDNSNKNHPVGYMIKNPLTEEFINFFQKR
ncbi:hypothetical protein QWT87_16385 [Chryseobacterium sp. APV1]|uniref:DUF4468 domain-containing protein n=1 Tax=Chryseobacterium urinae TaxID=3058400 RepID=A0ABT8U8S9_9FLAO|nr:hypothetical protein [Chryseobacterium sp. APV1]MDO3426460.1 hypothetical protein [Chryseobacterium sp. APV1]